MVLEYAPDPKGATPPTVILSAGASAAGACLVRLRRPDGPAGGGSPRPWLRTCRTGCWRRIGRDVASLQAAVQIVGWHAGALLVGGPLAAADAGLPRLVHFASAAFLLLGTACFCVGVAVPALRRDASGPAGAGRGQPADGRLAAAGPRGAPAAWRQERPRSTGEIRCGLPRRRVATQPVLAEELAAARRRRCPQWHGLLALSPDTASCLSTWALDTWTTPETLLECASIGLEAARHAARPAAQLEPASDRASTTGAAP